MNKYQYKKKKKKVFTPEQKLEKIKGFCETVVDIRSNNEAIRMAKDILKLIIEEPDEDKSILSI